MFNISEPAPMYVAGLLAVFWGVAQLLPAQTLYGLERYTVLRPLGVDALSTQGLTLLGHALAHGDFMHLAMNSLFIMIFGVAIVRAARIRGRRGDRPGRAVSVFLLLFILGVVGGGLAQWVEWAHDRRDQCRRRWSIRRRVSADGGGGFCHGRTRFDAALWCGLGGNQCRDGDVGGFDRCADCVGRAFGGLCHGHADRTVALGDPTWGLG